MSLDPACPVCRSENTYDDGMMLICPDCGHEWKETPGAKQPAEESGIRDAFGTLLQTGDSVTVIKDLKVKGSSSVLKVGTRVKNIRITEGDHPIDCKIDGFGAMQLKAEVVKKS
ncbi:MAG: alkylphosphonate utilization protein [Bacteroidetes bacterium]|nr:alkylphosphonate utilization protein [Bacteroidota bacterium]